MSHEFKSIKEWDGIEQTGLLELGKEIRQLTSKPSLIILNGEVGAGKTTFTKSFIDDGETFSPSYSIISESQSVIHADFYRLKEVQEITHLELALYLEDGDIDYFLVEWGREYLSTLLREIPAEYQVYQLKIVINHDQTRKFCLEQLA